MSIIWFIVSIIWNYMFDGIFSPFSKDIYIMIPWNNKQSFYRNADSMTNISHIISHVFCKRIGTDIGRADVSSTEHIITLHPFIPQKRGKFITKSC